MVVIAVGIEVRIGAPPVTISVVVCALSDGDLTAGSCAWVAVSVIKIVNATGTAIRNGMFCSTNENAVRKTR